MPSIVCHSLQQHHIETEGYAVQTGVASCWQGFTQHRSHERSQPSSSATRKCMPMKSSKYSTVMKVLALQIRFASMLSYAACPGQFAVFVERSCANAQIYWHAHA